MTSSLWHCGAVLVPWKWMLTEVDVMVASPQVSVEFETTSLLPGSAGTWLVRSIISFSWSCTRSDMKKFTAASMARPICCNWPRIAAMFS